MKKLLTGAEPRIFSLVPGAGVTPAEGGVEPTAGSTFNNVNRGLRGAGARALTIALLRAVGPAGRVISYELREDFADAARKNVAAFFGDAPNWTIKVRDLYAGFDETGVDRMFLDLAEPGRALAVAASALRPGAVLVCYVPTAVQLKDTVAAVQAASDFGGIEGFG